MLTALLLGGGLLSAQPASATLSTEGSGAYKESIEWMEWTSHDEEIPRSGVTRTTTREVSGQDLVTKCTLASVSGRIKGYRPGADPRDGFSGLYSQASGSAYATGITSLKPGPTDMFTVKCTATLNGRATPHQGLVFANARSLEQRGAQRITLDPAGKAHTWRIVDRAQSAQCSSAIRAYRWGGQRLDLSSTGPACQEGSSVVALAHGADEVRVGLRRGSVAIGVMLPADVGDAPNSYGAAASLINPNWYGGEVPQSRFTDISSHGFALARAGEPQVRLGATVDADSGDLASGDGLGDDLTGNARSDEDAVQANSEVSTDSGRMYTLRNVRCSGSGVIRGWIDWDRNGQYDSTERSLESAPCRKGAASLSWRVPNGSFSPGGSFMRLRAGVNTMDVSSPTGWALSGEVEDHAVTLNRTSP